MGARARFLTPAADMIHKLLLTVALLSCAVPRVVSAQAEWRVEGFSLTERGFRGTLLFRNGQSAVDTPIRGIVGLQISLARDTPRCAYFEECWLTSNQISRVGNVDTGRHDFAGGSSLLFTSESWSEDSCIRCWSHLYTAPSGLGALGCAAPYGTSGVTNFYAGRTCPASGFDGWFSLPFEWMSFEALPPGYVWQESALVAEFRYREWGDINGFLVPEPSSAVLLLAGVAVLGLYARRRGVRR